MIHFLSNPPTLEKNCFTKSLSLPNNNYSLEAEKTKNTKKDTQQKKIKNLGKLWLRHVPEGFVLLFCFFAILVFLVILSRFLLLF